MKGLSELEKDASQARRLRGVFMLNYGPKGAMQKGIVKEEDDLCLMFNKYMRLKEAEIKHLKDSQRQQSLF